MLDEAYRILGAEDEHTSASVASGYIETFARDAPNIVPALAQTVRSATGTPFYEPNLWVSSPTPGLFSSMPATGTIRIFFGRGATIYSSVRPSVAPEVSDVSLSIRGVRLRPADLANLLDGFLACLGLEDQRRVMRQKVDRAGPDSVLREILPVESGTLFSTELRRSTKGEVGYYVRVQMPPSEAAAALARLEEHAPALTLEIVSFDLNPATLTDGIHVMAREAPEALLTLCLEGVWPVDVACEVAEHTLNLRLYVFLRRLSPDGYVGLRLDYGIGDRMIEPGSPASAWDHDGRVRLALVADGPTWDKSSQNAQRLASVMAPWLSEWDGASKLPLV